MPTRGNRAGVAITLAILALIFMVAGIGIWMVMLTKMVQDRVGTNPTRQQMNDALQQIMAEGKTPRSPIVGAAVLIATVCSISALVMAISALIRHERGRGKAIVACILSAALLFCQVGMILAAMASRAAAGG